MLTIGILGGMGPAAGADFYLRLVTAHRVPRDQDHPAVLLYGATQVPDRTAYLLEGGPDPTTSLQEAARRLEGAGADFVVIPCNTAHAFLAAIREAVRLPVLDMIEIAVRALVERRPGVRRAGLLAASGTTRVGLYDPRLRRAGVEPLYPGPAVQDEVMAAIRAVKAGRRGVDERLLAAAEHLIERGSEALVLACTEVPLGLEAASFSVPTIDANQTLVEATLAVATGELTPQQAMAGVPSARP